MIVYIRSSLIQRDVRAQKYIHFLNENDLLFLQWDRENEFVLSDDRYITFKLNAEFGKRHKSLIKFFLWNLFLFKTIFQNRHRINVIQICDLDSFFGVVLFRLMGKKIIFDVYDFFTDSKLSNSGTMIYSLLYHIEMFCLQFIDLLILPLEIRKRHLNFIPEKLFICENVPLIGPAKDIHINFDRSILNVVYAGTLEAKNRGLEWIPYLADELKGKAHFYIAGHGGLHDFFDQASKIHENITFLGSITHAEALSLQRDADLIYGIYRTNLINNIMAAPNKYYESAYLGTPILTNRGIMIATAIEHNDIGFVVGESPGEILSFLNSIQKDQISAVAKKAHEFWIKNYSNYLNSTYKTEYQNHLERLSGY